MKEPQLEYFLIRSYLPRPAKHSEVAATKLLLWGNRNKAKVASMCRQFNISLHETESTMLKGIFETNQDQFILRHSSICHISRNSKGKWIICGHLTGKIAAETRT